MSAPQTADESPVADYKVLVNGRNYWFCVDGLPKRMGFYAARFVVAEEPAAAERAAVALIHGDLKGRDVLNDDRDPPSVTAEEIARVPASDVPAAQPGFAFYEEALDS